MTSFTTLTWVTQPSILTLNTDTGIYPQGSISLGRQRLDSEPVGSFTLRIQNSIAGSEYGVFVSSTNAAAGGTSSNLGVVSGTLDSTIAQFDLTLYYYSIGNPLNDLRLRLRKGTTGQKYLPFETFLTASTGVVNVYVIQVPDTIA